VAKVGGCVYGHGFDEVVEGGELFGSGYERFRITQLIQPIHVLKESFTLLPFLHPLVLFKQVSRTLLIHHDIYSFESTGWCLIGPNRGYPTRQRKPSTPTSLPQLINPIIRVASRHCFNTSSEMVERLHGFKVAFRAFFVCFSNHPEDNLACHCENKGVGHVIPYQLQMRLIINQFTLFLHPRHRFKLPAAHGIPCSNEQTIQQFHACTPCDIHSSGNHDRVKYSWVSMHLEGTFFVDRGEPG